MLDGTRHPARWLALGVLAAILSAVAWALASAPGSSPDDNFHMPSIWCAHGESADRCAPVEGDEGARAVPAETTGLIACFVFDNTKSAGCQQEVVEADGPLVPVESGNWQRSYPPVFYWVQGLLVTDHVGASILMMRVLAALVVISLVGALVVLVPSRMRPAAVVPLLVCSVPLGLSLFSSTNPSAWGVACPFVVLVALHAAFASSGRRQWALCAVALVATVAGAGARADACLFTAMAVMLALLVNAGRLRARLGVVIVGAVAVVASAVLFLGAGQASAVTSGLAAEQVLGEASRLSRFELAWANLTQLPTLWTGSLGAGPMGQLGWLDTPLPSLVGFLGIVGLAVVVALTWRRSPLTHVLALVLSGLALFVYPLYVLGRSQLVVGQGMQPRYLVPLVVVFVALVMLTGDGRMSRSRAYPLAGAAALANAIALHQQIRRYVTGLDESSFDLGAHREWWWGVPVGPTLVWAVGAVAFAAVAVVVLGLCTTTVEPDDDPATLLR